MNLQKVGELYLIMLHTENETVLLLLKFHPTSVIIRQRTYKKPECCTWLWIEAKRDCANAICWKRKRGNVHCSHTTHNRQQPANYSAKEGSLLKENSQQRTSGKLPAAVKMSVKEKVLALLYTCIVTIRTHD